MQRRDLLSIYVASGAQRLDDPDELLAFLESFQKDILVAAQKGYEAHGRGILVLKPVGEVFVMAQYATPEPGDFDQLGHDAARAFEAYDPSSEMLFGIPTPDGDFAGFWKMEVRYFAC